MKLMESLVRLSITIKSNVHSDAEEKCLLVYGVIYSVESFFLTSGGYFVAAAPETTKLAGSQLILMATYICI